MQHTESMHDTQRTFSLGQKCLAECIGTAFLVFVGCGAIAGSDRLHPLAIVSIGDIGAIALAFGIAIAIMIYAIGHISGCHINPAISFAFAVTRRMSWSDAGLYILSQLIGGIIGGLFLAIAYGGFGAHVSHYGATTFSIPLTGYFPAIILEAIGTFFLLFVVMGTALDTRSPSGWAGLMIGLTVTAGILAIGPITGGNFNPARSIGPVVATWLFGGYYSILYLIPYIVGPLIGGILGVLAYDSLVRMGMIRRPGYERMEVEGND